MRASTEDYRTRHERRSGRAIAMSVVLSLHREGPLLLATMQSLKEALLVAEAQGVGSELVVVLDDADRATTEQLARSGLSSFADLRIVEGRMASLGASRNVGAAAARGDWVCFADGDDLVSYNLVLAFHAAALQAGERTILMPQWLVTFGSRQQVGLVLPSARIGPLSLLSSNPFVSRICARRALIAAIPFSPDRADDGFAFEDWHHHCQTIASGCDLATVPDTLLFYRLRADGLKAQGETAAKAIAPSRLFEPDVYLARCASDYARYRSGRAMPTEVHAARAFADRFRLSLVRAAAAIDPSIVPDAYNPDDAFTSVSPYHETVGALYYEICRDLSTRTFSRIVIGDAPATAEGVPTLRVVAAPTPDAPSVDVDVDGMARAGGSATVRLRHDAASCELLCLKVIQAFGPGAEIVTDAGPFGSALLRRFGKTLKRSHAIVTR